MLGAAANVAQAIVAIRSARDAGVPAYQIAYMLDEPTDPISVFDAVAVDGALPQSNKFLKDFFLALIFAKTPHH
jgi:hypothetical protein